MLVSDIFEISYVDILERTPTHFKYFPRIKGDSNAKIIVTTNKGKKLEVKETPTFN